ncbi:fimbrial protein [Phocaeicola salanitronis]|uniref:fimbrial protein n=1 Tax=Phocaeicola salanitronis TaxID=376805 RepID=UPI0032081D39
MKKLIHLIYIIPVLLLAACNQEEAFAPTGTKTVQINLSTRVGQTEEGTDAENAIHSIRVYAFDATSNELVGYHYEPSINVEKTYIFQMPLNFSLKEDFTSGTVQAKFYIVVNEKAVTLDGTLPEADLEDGIPTNPSAVSPNALDDIKIQDYSIKTNVPAEGLPMSCAYENVTLNTETGQVLNFDLIRAISRIKVCFRNENNSNDIQITTLRFGNFIADKAYLFPKDEMPSNVSYTSNENIDISTLNISAPFQETSEAVSCYILPSQAGQGKYTFGFNEYALQELQANENGAYSTITELPRNTSLDIEATIKGDYIIFDIPSVNPWGEASGGIIIVD